MPTRILIFDCASASLPPGVVGRDGTDVVEDADEVVGCSIM